MDVKKCMKCGEIKPISDFYRHPGMKDGHLNKCKECAKRDVSANYRANKKHYQDYEHTERRVESRHRRAKQAQIKHRAENPDKTRARRMLTYHVRAGNLTRPNRCSVCGVECVPEGHHADYGKPLDVVWVCRQCHAKIHDGFKVN